MIKYRYIKANSKGEKMKDSVSVIGAGLAGCEAAWQIAQFLSKELFFTFENFHMINKK